MFLIDQGEIVIDRNIFACSLGVAPLFPVLLK